MSQKKSRWIFLIFSQNLEVLMYFKELVKKVCLDVHCMIYCNLVDSDIVNTSDEFNRPYRL